MLATKDETKQAVLVECSTNIPVTGLDGFIHEVKRKLDLVRRSAQFKDFAETKAFIVTSQRSFWNLRDRSGVYSKLRRAGIDVLLLETDLLPSLPHSYNKPEIVQLFRSLSDRHEMTQ